jgi:uncharacterized membrane protein
LAALLLTVAASPAVADLKLCNATQSRVGVAIGYKDQVGWATEGWWFIGANTCETLRTGPMPSRYLYVHAVDYDRSGHWAGTFFMCTTDKSFMIRDVKDCQARGFQRTGFYEVDTGEAKDWTIRLAEPDEGARPR